MMNLFKKYKETLSLIEDNYTSKEQTMAMLVANLSDLVIAIPVILVSIQMFTVFIMRPYLVAFFIYISFVSLSFIYFLFRKSILVNTRKVDAISYNFQLLIDALIAFLIYTLIFIICCLFVIPKFVL